MNMLLAMERKVPLEMAVFSSSGVASDDSPMCSCRLVFYDVIVSKDVLTKATLFVGAACEKATWQDHESVDRDMQHLKSMLDEFDEEKRFAMHFLAEQRADDRLPARLLSF